MGWTSPTTWTRTPARKKPNLEIRLACQKTSRSASFFRPKRRRIRAGMTAVNMEMITQMNIRKRRKIRYFMMVVVPFPVVSVLIVR